MNRGDEYYFPMESYNPEDNGYVIYNVFNEEARKLYWEQVEKGILVHGLDAT